MQYLPKNYRTLTCTCFAMSGRFGKHSNQQLNKNIFIVPKGQSPAGSIFIYFIYLFI